ncbi:Calcineurin-like phosphoesterase [Actinacidiphila yanglinensis]|uniref:Calcineurin-like phosphoesterase n=1 Tax=Actinacidiphila yanglinensis TaxID=310779 RepID=A0A1H6D782_9ACTN|nr:metallophosphoesterase [Actinacidiphila yanglinensis]SEG81162.1 Calcineurin-like phosphoesterase [Actinacidiphila yanglinensis]
MLTIAHISDPHLDGGPRAAERAARVVAALRAMPGPVDAVLLTGDVADHGAAAEYDEAAKLLDLPYPVLSLPGNHDRRPAFRAHLLGEPAAADGAGDEINRVVRTEGAVYVLCDSTLPGRDDGVLTDRTLAWLDTTVAEAGRDLPVFVCFHHPPVRLHLPYVDRIRQSGGERLAAVLERHPQVVAVLCGHAHTGAATIFAGRPLLVGPGIVSTVPLPLEGRPEIDLDLPPMIAFHVLDDERRLVTHFRVIA